MGRGGQTKKEREREREKKKENEIKESSICLVYSLVSELIAQTLNIAFFNGFHPVVYLIFNKMFYSVLIQL